MSIAGNNAVLSGPSDLVGGIRTIVDQEIGEAVSEQVRGDVKTGLEENSGKVKLTDIGMKTGIVEGDPVQDNINDKIKGMPAGGLAEKALGKDAVEAMGPKLSEEIGEALRAGALKAAENRGQDPKEKGAKGATDEEIGAAVTRRLEERAPNIAEVSASRLTELSGNPSEMLNLLQNGPAAMGTLATLANANNLDAGELLKTLDGLPNIPSLSNAVSLAADTTSEILQAVAPGSFGQVVGAAIELGGAAAAGVVSAFNTEDLKAFSNIATNAFSKILAAVNVDNFTVGDLVASAVPANNLPAPELGSGLA